MQIDFVIPWVDGSDPEWQKERNLHCNHPQHTEESRFRDWETLRYWFRAVETYAPWVNKIFFITWGHIPSWLNQDHPKIRFIVHKDYIPSKYLPTFNSHTIELNLHRIPELSEHFVYFNDDTFLNAPVSPEDFFKNGFPCNCAVLEPFMPVDPTDSYSHILLNNMAFINKHFKKYNVLKKHPFKWFHPVYGKYFLKNLYFTPGKLFSGFRNLHIPTSMQKSTFQNLWDLEPELLDATCKNKFRTSNDVNQNIMSYYDLCTGRFSPRSAVYGKCYGIGQTNSVLFSDMKSGSHKLICINDHPYINNFDLEKEILLKAFQEKLPQKSSFEI